MPRRYAPRRPKRRSNRRPARRPRRSNRRSHRKTIAPMETACLKETVALGVIDPNLPYEPQFNLTQFVRALDVADNYHEFRISKIEYLYTPKYDTFGSLYSPTTSNVQVSIPYLYTKKQTAPTPDTWTLDFLIKQGARPIRLDDKTIRHSYRPHILQGGLNEASTLATPSVRAVRSPWISTHQTGAVNPDNTVHYTHAFWIQQQTTNPAFVDVCSLEATVYFEFRKPWDNTSSPEGAPSKRNPFVRSV